MAAQRQSIHSLAHSTHAHTGSQTYAFDVPLNGIQYVSMSKTAKEEKFIYIWEKKKNCRLAISSLPSSTRIVAIQCIKPQITYVLVRQRRAFQKKSLVFKTQN